MGLVLAVQPDRDQAARLSDVVRGRVSADLLVAATLDEALMTLEIGVPDLILIPPLMTARDEARLAERLRAQGAAAAHVQTLTIPLLADAAPKPSLTSGLFARFTRQPREAPPPAGCDVETFAREVQGYLDRARAERDRYEGSQWRAAGAAPAPQPAPAFEDAATAFELPELDLEPMEVAAVDEDDAIVLDVGGDDWAPVPLEPLEPEPAQATAEPDEQVPVWQLDATDLTSAIATPFAGSTLEDVADDVVEIDAFAASELVQDIETPVAEAPIIVPVPEPVIAAPTMPAVLTVPAAPVPAAAPVFAAPRPAAPVATATPEMALVPLAAPPAADMVPAPVAVPEAPPVLTPAVVAAPVNIGGTPVNVGVNVSVQTSDGASVNVGVNVSVTTTTTTGAPIVNAAAPPTSKDLQRGGKRDARVAPHRPAQDEWGFFDPDQCGFSALVAKLDEITETEHGTTRRSGTMVRVISTS